MVAGIMKPDTFFRRASRAGPAPQRSKAAALSVRSGIMKPESRSSKI
jgi:hypothetical protein